MKKLITITALLYCQIAVAQYMHIDVSIGGNTRLHSVANLGVTYQSVSGFEASLLAGLENKHNTWLGATAGIRAWVNDLASDGVVFYAGASYQFYTQAAKTELQNGIMPIIGIRMQDNWGSCGVSYQQNSFAVNFGYRFLNHNK